MRLTLKQLQIFRVVAEQQSYTRAAKALYLTQPAVSMQIKQLEAEIGMPVFDRIGKQIQLTDAGRELLRHARNIQIQLEETQQSMEALRGIRRGRLHLTMASTANYFTPKMLAGFCREYPDIQISLKVANRAGLLDALANNTTDLVIMGEPPATMPLASEIFMENPLVIIAAPTHPLAQRKDMIRLHEVARENFIIREIGSGTRAAVERFLSTHEFDRPQSIEMNSSEAIKQAVQAGLGLGVVSMHTLEMELALNRLVVLNVEGLPIMRHWYLVYRKDRHFSPVSQAFHDYVLSHAAELRPEKTPEK
ncbi:MAG: LysR family transcriptional regulator [Zetaproteobacteria bacterium]|nr:MAG: LysR family transcriptional regulator [Zetaproteobacteria bacterium]